jgi:branched-chain amino acid transport system substrate-binding protein
MRRLGSVILALALVLGMGLGAVALAAEYKIGVAVPLTGLFGKDGELIRDAYTFWAETVNAQGGMGPAGKKAQVKLIFRDDMSDPQTSSKLVEQLISGEQVDLLLGGFGSGPIMAASAASERAGYPMISGAASSNKLFERNFKYYFSTLGKATDEVKGAVDVFLTMDPKPQSVAIIGANTPFTADACQGFKKFAEAAGVKVVHFELFPPTLQDYNTMLEKAKAASPDVLLVGSHLGVALRVMKAMKEIKFAPKGVAFSYGPTVPAFVQGLGKDAEYVFAASEWTPNLPYAGPLFGTAKDFNEAYFKRFNRYPDYVEAATVAGALAQQTVLEQLGLQPPLKPEDRQKIMEGLHKLDLNSFYGRVKFDPEGANEAHPPVAVQIQDGKLVNVYPAAAAESKPRYPMPAWDQR